MADVNDAGLENLELAKINTTANAPYTAEANFSPERLAHQEKLDVIINAVRSAGSVIVPQSDLQVKTVKDINGFNNNQPELDALNKHYNIKYLAGGLSYDDYYEIKDALSSLSENPNGYMLNELLDEVGGFKDLVKSNSEFDESLDYDKKLEIYGVYLKEKYSAGVFHKSEFVNKSSLDELVDLKKTPNPERLDSIIQEMGGNDKLITKAASYKQEINGFYDKGAALKLADKIIMPSKSQAPENIGGFDYDKAAEEIKTDNSLKAKDKLSGESLSIKKNKMSV